MNQLPVKMVLGREDDKRRLYDALAELDPGQQPVEISIKAFAPRRSLRANGLYWMWMGELAEQLTEREPARHAAQMEEHQALCQAGRRPAAFPAPPQEYSKDDLHDYCRARFLSRVPDRRVGSVMIAGQLRSTATLSRGEFCDYLRAIEVWAGDCGLLLSNPDEGEYYDYLVAQGVLAR